METIQRAVDTIKKSSELKIIIGKWNARAENAKSMTYTAQRILDKM